MSVIILIKCTTIGVSNLMGTELMLRQLRD